MHTKTRGQHRLISKVKPGRIHEPVAAAAKFTAERLEDRLLLTTYFVNFTNGPASNTLPHTPPVDVPGYMTDIGQPFGDRTDRGNPGVSYGWVDPTTGAPKDDQVNGRNRDVATSPDERYDSFNHMMKPSNTDQSGWVHWEIAIPNGQYQVRIVSGDISNVNSHFILTAEGQVILDGIPTAATALSHFIDQTGIVTVADGRLTIGNGPGADNNKIAFIEISDPSSVTPPTQAPVLLSALGTGGKVVLNWQASPGASSYNLFRGSATGTETLYKTGLTGTTYTDTAVTVGNTYFYYLVPTNLGGAGPQSNEVSTRVTSTYAHINFQTATTVTPTGYLPDTGSAFGDRGNGFSYGWWNSPDNGTTAVPTTDPSTRERNVNPDKRLDTIVQLHKVGESPPVGMVWWEINVPNGTYQVHMVAGDASNADEYLSFVAEANKNAGGVPDVNSGITLIHTNLNGTGLGNFADSGTIDVTVTDGNLTISEGPDAANNKVAYIEVDTLTVATKPADPTNLTISNLHASNLTLNWNDNSTDETGFRIEQSTDGTTFTPMATAPSHTGTGPVSFLVTGLTPQTHYYYRVFALNLQGDSINPTNTADAITLVATGAASGRTVASTGEINLTAEGTADWVHWGLNDANTFDHKTGVTSLISDVTPIAGAAKVQLTNSPTTFTWTDGNPDTAATATPNELGTFAFGHGFSFSVAADTTFRALRVYVGVTNVRGQFIARLSDGSAADYVDTSLFNATATDAVYTVVYKAASAGQTLNVSWIEFPPNGDQVAGRLNIKAATLQVVQPATGTATNVVATAEPSGRVYLTWTDQSTNGFGYQIERAPDAGGSPGTFAVVGTTTNPQNWFLDQGTLGMANTKFYYRLTPLNIALVPGATASAVAPVTTVAVLGDGAQANYYAAPDLNGGTAAASKNPIFGAVWPTTSIDPTINFNWGNGAPPGAGAGFPVDNFITRWTATIKPDVTDTFTFWADTDDGYRLFVNGKKILDGLDRRGGLAALNAPTFNSTPITLVAGQSYDLVFDQDEQTGGAGARLYWSASKLPREIIPQFSMTHAPLDVTPPKVIAIQVDGQLPAGATYTAAQHVIVKFSENVGGLDTSAGISITGNLGNGYSGNQIAVAYDSASHSAILTFPLDTLPDDNYTITIAAAGVYDDSGNPLDGNNDGTGGDDFTGKFYVLTGDTHEAYNGNFNDDRKVSFIDFQRLELGFGKGAADRVSNADGDFNHDGVVDSLDVAIFNQKLGQTLPPAPAAPVSAPAPAPAPVTTTTTKKVVTKTPVKTPPKPVKKVAPPPVVTKPPVRTAFTTKRLKGVGDWLEGN